MSLEFRNFVVFSESISPDLMRYIASEVRRWLTIGIGTNDMAEGLYRAFRYTDTPDGVEIKRNAWKDKERAYYYELIRLKWPNGYTPLITPSWFLANKTEKIREKERDRHKYYDIHHKVYFTIKSSTWESIVAFLHALPDLTSRFLKFKDDDVELKVPTRISTLATNADNLIVYYKNVQNRPAIESTVRRWMVDHQIGSQNRQIRAMAGFDISDGREDKSHTQLVCTNVAEKIKDEGEKLLHMDIDALASWLWSAFARAAVSDFDLLPV